MRRAARCRPLLLALLLSGCADCRVLPIPVGAGGPMLRPSDYQALYQDGLDLTAIKGCLLAAFC